MQQETVVFIKKVVKQNQVAYAFMNNRAEGNAPVTVQALAGALWGEGWR